MDKKVRKLRTLIRHRNNVERALLAAMMDIYGSRRKVEEVCAMPGFRRLVLSDLEAQTRKAYEAAHG